MEYTEAPLGAWTPDLPDYGNPGLVDALNIVPIAGGYAPFLAPVSEDDTTDERVRGAAHFLRDDDQVSVFVAGSASKLWHMVEGIVTATPGFATSNEEPWRFERYNNMLLATNYENPVQVLNNVNIDSTFSDLGGTPPRARIIGRINDFVFLGDLLETGDERAPSRVRWSALNNPNGPWVTDYGELSDYRTLRPKWGAITGFVEQRVALVFQERAVHRVSFVGAPKVFEFDPISDELGCIAPDSIVEVGDRTFFLSSEGFAVTDGSSVQLLSGDAGVQQWFTSNSAGQFRNRVQGAVDHRYGAIFWNYHDNTDTSFDRQIIYSFRVDGWSTGALENDWLLESSRAAYTLADLDAEYPDGVGTVIDGDGVGIPVGNPEWSGQPESFGCFLGDGATTSTRQTLVGLPLAASFITGDWQATGGSTSFCSGVSAMVQGEVGWKAALRGRENPGGSLTTTPQKVSEADNYAPVRMQARFLSTSVSIPGGAYWDRVSAVKYRLKPGGRR